MYPKELTTIRNVLVFFASVLILGLLYLLQDLFIPLILAIFVALLFHPVLVWFEKKKLPVWAGVSIIWLSLIIIVILISYIIYNTGIHLYDDKDYIISQSNIKLESVIHQIEKITHRPFDYEQSLKNITELISSEILLRNSGTIFGKLGFVFEQFLLTSIYLLILLSGIMKYKTYLSYLGGESQSQKLIDGFEEIKNSINSYMKVKFIISLLYGVGITVICLLFGLQYAFFWGFIGFFLNFLPVFGAIIGLIPVFIMGLIQFDSPYTAIALNLIVYGFHFVLSNFLEPIMLGAKTSLNVIAVILGLLFWGFLWGIYGMFLSVPLMVLTKVVLSQIGGMELIVRLLGVQENK